MKMTVLPGDELQFCHYRFGRFPEDIALASTLHISKIFRSLVELN